MKNSYPANLAPNTPMMPKLSEVETQNFSLLLHNQSRTLEQVLGINSRLQSVLYKLGGSVAGCTASAASKQSGVSGFVPRMVEYSNDISEAVYDAKTLLSNIEGWVNDGTEDEASCSGN